MTKLHVVVNNDGYPHIVTFRGVKIQNPLPLPGREFNHEVPSRITMLLCHRAMAAFTNEHLGDMH